MPEFAKFDKVWRGVKKSRNSCDIIDGWPLSESLIPMFHTYKLTLRHFYGYIAKNQNVKYEEPDQ